MMPASPPNVDRCGTPSSALGQEGSDLELIVVDDGHGQPITDLLADVRDPRLRHVRVNHGGSPLPHRRPGRRRGVYLRYIAPTSSSSPAAAALLDLSTAARTTSRTAQRPTATTVRPLWTMVSRHRARRGGDAARPGQHPARAAVPRAVVERTGGWDDELIVSQDWASSCARSAARVVGDGAPRRSTAGTSTR